MVTNTDPPVYCAHAQWDCAGSGWIRSTCPPRLVSLVYIQTCRSRYGGSLAEDLGNQGWCVEAQPFSLSMMPTGFLCLCCSRSADRQVRKGLTEAKRKLSWGTFRIKSSLFDDGTCNQYSDNTNFFCFCFYIRQFMNDPCNIVHKTHVYMFNIQHNKIKNYKVMFFPSWYSAFIHKNMNPMDIAPV